MGRGSAGQTNSWTCVCVSCSILRFWSSVMIHTVFFPHHKPISSILQSVLLTGVIKVTRLKTMLLLQCICAPILMLLYQFVIDQAIYSLRGACESWHWLKVANGGGRVPQVPSFLLPNPCPPTPSDGAEHPWHVGVLPHCLFSPWIKQCINLPPQNTHTHKLRAQRDRLRDRKRQKHRKREEGEVRCFFVVLSPPIFCSLRILPHACNGHEKYNVSKISSMDLRVSFQKTVKSFIIRTGETASKEKVECLEKK